MPKAFISDASWNRIYLNITAQAETQEGRLSFYLTDKSGKVFSKLEEIKKDGNEYILQFNVTNAGNCRCLPDGEYRIVCSSDDENASLCINKADLSGLSRSFKYHSGCDAYNITFAHDAEFSFTCADVRLSPKKTDIKTLLMQLILKLVYRVFRRGGKRKKTILFMSEQSRSIAGNEKAVYDRMIERQLDKQFIILKSFRNAVSEHQGISGWIKFVRTIARSSTVILDDHAPALDWLVLKDTKIIQLWHAGAGFKAAGYSRWGNEGCPAPFSCHRQYTYGISGSERISHFFSEVFGINTQQILPAGMPRMDKYLDPENKSRTISELYKEFPLCEGRKIILFAPTYRGINNSDAYYPYELIDFKKLYEACGDEYAVLFKMHPFDKKPVPIPKEYRSRFADAGGHSDINDLFYITDLLITDYSSNIFEYSLNKKPMLFFAFDEDEYSLSRGFHRDYSQSAPGKIVRTFDELIEAVKNRDFEIEKVYNYVDVHFDYIDSHASDRVIDWLILDKMPEKFRQAIDKKNEDVRRTLALCFKPENLKNQQYGKDR